MPHANSSPRAAADPKQARESEPNFSHLYLVCKDDVPLAQGFGPIRFAASLGVDMATIHPAKWYFSRLSLGLATGLLGILAGLLLFSPVGTSQADAGINAASTAAYQTTEKLVLTVSVPKLTAKETKLQVEILDDAGKVVAVEERLLKASETKTGQRFEFAAPVNKTDKLSLHCKLDKDEFTVPLNKVLLVKAHETALSAGQEYFSNSLGSLRCEVHAVRSLTENVPLPGAAVTIQLQYPDKQSSESIELYTGKVGADGVADVQFKVPALKPGSYRLVVATKSDLGSETLEKLIKIKSAPRVMLVSDKPLYQPGQMIHLPRWLCNRTI